MARGQRASVRNMSFVLILVALGVAAVAYAWNPGSTVPGRAWSRLAMIIIVIMLIAMPVLCAAGIRGFGPSSAVRFVRTIRGAAYVGVWALLFAMIAIWRFGGQRFESFRAYDQTNWTAAMAVGALTGGLALLVVLGGYAFLILATTSRHWSAAPHSIAPGAVIGLLLGLVSFALAPFGDLFPRTGGTAAGLLAFLRGLMWLIAPLIAGWAATRRHRTALPSNGVGQGWRRDGAVAGLWSWMIAALVATTLTLIMMRLFPGQVTLEWANPDPNVPHGTPYEIEMSVSDAAARYLPLLFLAPLVGPALGALLSRREPLRPATDSLL